MPGFHRSLAGAAVALILVAGGLAATIRGEVTEPASAKAEPDMTAARAEVVRGCLDQGQGRSVCECYGDEVLRRTGNRAERFGALEREMVERERDGRSPPALIVDAAQYCAGRGG
jgi:hypothetical protein